MIKLSLLGPPHREGPDAMSPVKVPSASAGLLAYLVLHPKPVTREHLASLLWPKAESSKARHSLRQLLTRIRKVFPDVLVTDKERIGVNPDRIQVDVHQLEEDIRERRLRSALALWQGPFLEGWSWPDSWELEDWVERERSRLWRLLEQAFLEVGEALLSAARPTDALELLNAGVPELASSDGMTLLRARALAAAGFRPEAESILAASELDGDDDRVVAALEEIRNGNGLAAPVPVEEDLGGVGPDEEGPHGGPGRDRSWASWLGRKRTWVAMVGAAVLVLGMAAGWFGEAGGGGQAATQVATPRIPPVEVWFCSNREEERAFRMNEDGDQKFSLTRVDACPVIPVNSGELALGLRQDPEGVYLGAISTTEFDPIAGPFPVWGNSVPSRQAGALDGTVSIDGQFMVAALESDPAGPGESDLPRFLDGIGPFEPEAKLDLALIDLQNGDLTWLTEDASRDYEPRFLPDGSGIIWGSQRDGPGDAYYFDLATGEIERLTHGDLPARDFSVQGNLMAYHRGWGDGDEEGDQDLYLFDLTTRVERRLTENDWNDTGPELSFDGRMICWTAKRGGHWEAEIMAMDLATGESWQVTNVPGRVDYCQWHPSAPVVFYQLWGDDEPEIYRSGWGAKGPHLNLSRHVTADKGAVIMGVNR